MLSKARNNHHSSGEHERGDEHSHRRGGEQDEEDSEQPEETGDRETGAVVRPIHEEDSTPLFGGTTSRTVRQLHVRVRAPLLPAWRSLGALSRTRACHERA